MHCRSLKFILPLVLVGPCLANTRADTARLAGRLARFRTHQSYELSATEYASVPREYLDWIDYRIKMGVGVARMNEELNGARLLSDGPQTIDDQFNRTYAGFLGKIEERSGTEHLLVITFGIYTGGYCNFDETVVLYGRTALRRLARINAEQSYTHGYHLRALGIGRIDPSGEITGSAWVASNCTSNWNGNVFRIDRLKAPSHLNILSREVSAFFGDRVEIGVENDTVTFRYTTLSHDLDVLTRAGIARYRVQGTHVVREAPIALSFGGFVAEWLEMDDTEAARWSTLEAGARHHELAARLSKGLLEWEHVADCPGSPPAREVSIRWADSREKAVFLVSGSHATEMGMLSVSDKPSASCREIDINADLTSVFAEPIP